MLDSSSLIHKFLATLKFLDLHVGDDDITADKDYKHVFKRLHNLLLHQCGIYIHGIHVTQANICAHLHDNGVSALWVASLLKPDDKQDVKLAYDLLHEITNLPDLDASTAKSKGFYATCQALCILGALF